MATSRNPALGGYRVCNVVICTPLYHWGGITQGPSTPSLYWSSTTLLHSCTPTPFFAGVHECIFNLPHPDLPPYSRHGRVVWSMEYGYPSRHLSLWLNTKLPVGHKRAALRLVMQRALSLVGVPPRHSMTCRHHGGSSRGGLPQEDCVGYFVGLNDTCYASHCACFGPHCLCHEQVPYDYLVTAVHRYLGPFSVICHTPGFIPAQFPR